MMLKRSLACAALIALSAWHAQAAEPDWPQRQVTLQAQEQPIGEFLRELFRTAGMQAAPSNAISGRISGRFSGSPEKIFRDVVKAYDLLPYYDGAVMHVYTDKQELLASQRARAAKPAKASLRPEPPPGVPRTLVFRSFPLKYASAADQTFYQNGREMRVPGVVSLLRSMTGIGSSLIAASPSLERQRGRSVPSVRGQGLRRYDTKEGTDENPEEEQPQEAKGFVGDQPSAVRIEADPNLNMVLVRDYEDSMAMYPPLIAQLDQQPQLIEIKVTIIDIDRSKLKELGVDWRYDSRNTSISAGGGDPGPQNGGLLMNTVLGEAGRFLARVNALAQNGSAQVVSRPQVLTLSNLEAVLATDQSFFVRVAGREEVDLFDVSVGTSLHVVPVLAGDPQNPQIRLRVAIEDGSLSPDQSVDNIPVVERSTLNTQAVIYDGQSLLLGGLTRDETTRDTTKVPGLGDIPGVGRLFKRTTNVTTSQERLFLIEPQIIANNQMPARAPAAPPPANNTRQAGTPQGYLDGF
jgi:type III secretion protein C